MTIFLTNNGQLSFVSQNSLHLKSLPSTPVTIRPGHISTVVWSVVLWQRPAQPLGALGLEMPESAARKTETDSWSEDWAICLKGWDWLGCHACCPSLESWVAFSSASLFSSSPHAVPNGISFCRLHNPTRARRLRTRWPSPSQTPIYLLFLSFWTFALSKLYLRQESPSLCRFDRAPSPRVQTLTLWVELLLVASFLGWILEYPATNYNKYETPASAVRGHYIEQTWSRAPPIMIMATTLLSRVAPWSPVNILTKHELYSFPVLLKASRSCSLIKAEQCSRCSLHPAKTNKCSFLCMYRHINLAK